MRKRLRVCGILTATVALVWLCASAIADQLESPRDLNQVKRLIADGEYARAEALARELLTDTEKRLGRDSLETANVLDELVTALVSAGKATADETRVLAERAFQITTAVLGPEHSQTAQCLSNLGTLQAEAGDFKTARATFSQVLAIQEKSQHPDDRTVAGALDNLGAMNLYLGDFKAARQEFERAVSIRERMSSGDDIELAQSLSNLGTLHQQTGNLEAAKPLYERTIAIIEAALGPDHPHLGVCRTNLGTLLHTMGDFAEARKHLERAIAIDEKALGPEHPGLATDIYNLAVLLQDIGDYEEARALNERALAIREKVLGSDHALVGIALNHMGLLAHYTGDLVQAQSYFERAIEISTKARGPDHPRVAASVHNLATLYAAQGAFDKAEPLFGRALDIYEKSYGPSSPQVGSGYAKLGGLFEATGRAAEALAAYKRSLSIREDALGPDNPQVGSSLDALAGLLFREGKEAKALDCALRAERISRDHLRLTAQTLPERQALRYAAVRTRGLDVALSIAARAAASLPGTVEKVWDELVRSRALVLDEMANRRRAVVAPSDRKTADLAARLAASKQRLANLTVRGPRGRQVEAFRQQVERARRTTEDLERTLAERSSTFRKQLTMARAGLKEVAAALPQGSALIAYVRYDRREPDARADAEEDKESPEAVAPAPPVPSYLALVLHDDRAAATAVPLGPAEDTDLAIAAWRREASQGALRSEGAREAYRAAGGSLRQRIWDPLGDHLKGVDRVFIVPDGAIHLVSFSALPVGKTGYLVEAGHLVHYLSAERDLASANSSQREANGLLVMAAPDFNDTTRFAALGAPANKAAKPGLIAAAAALFLRGTRSASCGGFLGLEFDPLPGTATEAEQIVSFWKKAEGTAASSSVLRLEGHEATETSFKQLAPGKRTLHLATHGFFLGGECAASQAGTRGFAARQEGVIDEPMAAPLQNPLLLAGLAFAGANHREHAGPQEDDGILTAEEIAVLDLSGVECAILSACDTGVGKIESGEGVLGLRRAFEVAGVDSLVMSLWPVEDGATREWMKALYRSRYAEGKGIAEAVRVAALTLLQDRRKSGESTHPFFWGAFVAAGGRR